MPHIIIKNNKTHGSCDRFTEPPKTETINISLEHSQNHLQKTENNKPIRTCFEQRNKAEQTRAKKSRNKEEQTTIKT